MTNTTKATPRKWKLGGGDKWSIWSEDGRLIANCGGHSSNVNPDEIGDENRANAALIVEAVNHFDEMKAALEFYADPNSYLGIGFMYDPPVGKFARDWDTPDGAEWEKPGKLARAILAKLEEG